MSLHQSSRSAERAWEWRTMIEQKDVKVRMRDGVEIGLRIYRPDGRGRHPAFFAA